MIVVDTNIIAYLFIPGIHTPLSERALYKDQQWSAPLLWRSELRNVLSGYLRRKHLSLDTALQIITKAEELLSPNEYSVPSDKVLDFVMKSKCSAYDCEFAVLADDLKVPLVTTDNKILKSFPKIAVSLLKFAQ